MRQVHAHAQSRKFSSFSIEHVTQVTISGTDNIQMSSKNAANMKLCQGKDVLERMNYLYQASHLMAIDSKNLAAASYYGNIMVGCAKKAVLRMNPDVKRTVCKSCQSPLIPGVTARVRLSSKPVKMVKWTCLTCNSRKKFPTKKGYKLWSDEPEALVESFDYTPKFKTEVRSLDGCERTEKCIELMKPNSLSMDRTTSSSYEFLGQNKEPQISSVDDTSINIDQKSIPTEAKDAKTNCNVSKD